MLKPRILVLSGYGLNCEEETAFAFERAGGSAEIVHLNDLIRGIKKLKNYQILAVPGGFSFGDDTGSGKAFANKFKNHLSGELQTFVESDKLVIGICNGFQILTNLGLLPGALVFNDSARYIDRWVDIKIEGKSPWLAGINMLSVPIAHGEGKYFAEPKTLNQLKKAQRIAATYAKGDICRREDLPANPNGSLNNIAAVLSYEGRVLGLMPPPERAISFTQLPHWTRLKEEHLRAGRALPKDGPGLQLFQNAVRYFQHR